MSHQQVALDLLEGVEHNAHHNEQGGAAEELCELLVHAEVADDGRQHGHDTQEDGTGQGDTGHNRVDQLSGLLAGLGAGDEAAVLLQVFRNLLRVDGDGRVEVGEGDDEQEEHHVIAETVIVDEAAPEAGGGLRGDVDEGQGDEHNSLGEDDRHHAGSVDLEGKIVADTAVLLVADHALGVLDGHAAGALHEHNADANDDHHQDKLDDEDDRATVHLADTSHELSLEGVGQTGDDTDHNDHRDTVADAVVGDSLTKPHNEEGGGDEEDEGRDGERREAEDAGREHRGGDGAGELVGELGDIGGSLDGQHEHRQITGDLVDFLTAAFAFLLETLEIGHRKRHQLDDNGCGDVRHNTQREDGGVGECAAGEEVEHTEQTLLGRAGERGEAAGVDTREHHVRTKTVYQDDEERVEDSLSQVFNPENVFYSFDEFFHCRRKVKLEIILPGSRRER